MNFISCPLCEIDVVDCHCDPTTPGFYHPDLETDADVRAEMAERDAIDIAAGIEPGWHKQKATS